MISRIYVISHKIYYNLWQASARGLDSRQLKSIAKMTYIFFEGMIGKHCFLIEKFIFIYAVICRNSYSNRYTFIKVDISRWRSFISENDIDSHRDAAYFTARMPRDHRYITSAESAPRLTDGAAHARALSRNARASHAALPDCAHIRGAWYLIRARPKRRTILTTILENFTFQPWWGRCW